MIYDTDDVNLCDFDDYVNLGWVPFPDNKVSIGKYVYNLCDFIY